MLVNSKDILMQAKKEGYALPAPDFLDLDMARVFVKTAERLNKPMILSFAQIHRNMISLEEAATVGRMLADSVSTPVVLHLDHGTDYEYIKQAIELGFSSVMIDASDYSFELNAKLTQQIVKLARPYSVTIEAEIGHVGQGENYSGCDYSDNVYTTTEEAVKFVEMTQVDSLAVSIGTSHGIYKNNINPTLNFERLHELTAAVPVPLVLHGASGSGDENLRRCAKEGISKINIYTDFLVGAMKNIDHLQPKDFISLKKAINNGMESVLEHYYHLFS